jgi:hypothetical protein
MPLAAFLPAVFGNVTTAWLGLIVRFKVSAVHSIIAVLEITTIEDSSNRKFQV